MTEQEFRAAQRPGEATAFAVNLIVQRDDALRRIAAWDANRDQLNKDLADARKSRTDDVAALNAQITALGGTALAQQLAKDKRRAELLAQRDAADKELAAM